MEEEYEDRYMEIIHLASKLRWIHSPEKTPYPIMNLPDVEKCMKAMIDDTEMDRLRNYINVQKEANING